MVYFLRSLYKVSLTIHPVLIKNRLLRGGFALYLNQIWVINKTSKIQVAAIIPVSASPASIA